MNSNRKATLFVKNFVISSQPIDTTEDSLRSHFHCYGKVKSCIIPKDYYTGKAKGYAFVNFYSERDCRFALENCGEKLFMDKLLIVSFAHEKKNSRSRSRSPSNSTKIDSELQSEIESLLKTKEELIKKNNEISFENDKLRRELREQTELKKSLKSQLKSYKNGSVIYLPCGHSKLISVQENTFYEEIFQHALLHLSAKEAENPIILKQLKNRVLEILNSKFPESFKCKEKENFIIGKCGHVFNAECYRVNCYKDKERVIECPKLIEKLLPCGHTHFVECWKEYELFVCKNC